MAKKEKPGCGAEENRHRLEQKFSAKVRMRPKNQITVPSGVTQTLQVREGDELEFTVNDRGEVVVRGFTSVPADQAWFFSPEWLAGEREAGEQIAAGRTDFYEDVDALFAGLAEDDETDEDDEGGER